MYTKILSIYVNLQDRELNLPDYIKKQRGIIHICPGSLERKMIEQEIAVRLSDNSINEIKQLTDKGWLIGQRGYVGKCKYPHADGTDPWHENMCLYNPHLSFDEQMEIIEKGREILEKHNLAPRVYSPINHLWDENTLRVVAKREYKFMMDKNCNSILPYEREGVVILPEVRFSPQHVLEAGLLDARKNAAVYVPLSSFSSALFNSAFWAYSQFQTFVLPSEIELQQIDKIQLIRNEYLKIVGKLERDLRRLRR